MFFGKRLSRKMAAFLYDHPALPNRGKNLRKSYKDVEKIILNIGKEKK